MEDEHKEWINKSEKDLNTAKYNLKGNIFDASVFYAQQSVEKALKSLLLKKLKTFPKVHDLTRLARLVNAPEKIIELCSKINPGYIVSRYPDQEEIYSKAETEEIIKFAEEVIKWTKENLI